MAIDIGTPAAAGTSLERALWPLTRVIVLSRVTALPGGATDGDIYIVPHGAGAHPDEIAFREAGAWVYVTPTEGWGAYVLDEGENVRFNGATWDLIITTGIPSSYLDLDGTLGANSDVKVASQKAVKTYVDTLMATVGNGGKVRVKTTGNVAISTALNAGDVVDGVTLANGDAVLVPVQTAPEQNGIYIVGAVPARSTSFDTYDEHAGAIIVVEEGTTYADTLWLCTANKGGTLNTTAISFIQMVLSGTVPSSRTISPGTGMTGGGDLSADRTLSVDKASAAQVQAATSNKVLTADIIFTAADPATLTDAATIAVDMATFLNAKVTLAGNRTLGAPSNPKNGQSGCIEIIQDGTGTRTLAYHADWLFAGGTDPVLSTPAGTKDLLFYQVMSNGKTYASLVKAVA
ncbi:MULTISPECIES: DUF2793 domain-containing protein [unclassified Mesorhizobium]|uniref:DUF2793 domain-containing protein n=1 Tax=unclassified Mesorhizobium TaxID=325217 RepID=UPI000FCBE6AA|nr:MULTISPECIES: DUF2793 domain-containing protein [unclassified Mesorhizobium]RUX93793.1 DUF2793 domain-containing protein [Mesorhizobium sp. M7D.F.Ca.US.004.01.2.1]RVA34872.1 DUF2793 domain-containing protein [Mesorhizobium sp. M7D.F.Ca.US.004.03.1.1]